MVPFLAQLREVVEPETDVVIGAVWDVQDALLNELKHDPSLFPLEAMDVSEELTEVLTAGAAYNNDSWNYAPGGAPSKLNSRLCDFAVRALFNDSSKFGPPTMEPVDAARCSTLAILTQHSKSQWRVTVILTNDDTYMPDEYDVGKYRSRKLAEAAMAQELDKLRAELYAKPRQETRSILQILSDR